jgi:hypothetical protein
LAPPDEVDLIEQVANTCLLPLEEVTPRHDDFMALTETSATLHNNSA